MTVFFFCTIIFVCVVFFTGLLPSPTWQIVSQDQSFSTSRVGSFSNVSRVARAERCVASCKCKSFGYRTGRARGDCVLYKKPYIRLKTPANSPGFVIYDWAARKTPCPSSPVWRRIDGKKKNDFKTLIRHPRLMIQMILIHISSPNWSVTDLHIYLHVFKLSPWYITSCICMCIYVKSFRIFPHKAVIGHDTSVSISH